MANYLNSDGLLYLWLKIKGAFATKDESIKNIQRNGTTFTVTRADSTTFTFDQQDTNTTYDAATSEPLMDGTAAVGVSAKYAREDHVHPSDDSKVDKVTGKGLSTNDYTTTEKNKLSSIAEGATANTASTSSPLMDGTAAAGSSASYARGDHVHPSDTTKVDKEEGKGLSTNDYTTTEKNKLGGISAGAEVNQNAFSTVAVGSTNIAAGSKTATLTLVGGSNITLTPNAQTGQVTIAANGDTYDAMTAAEATAGTSTTSKVITPKILADAINERVEAAKVGAAMFQGTVNSGTAISSLTSYKRGYYWVVATAGSYVGQTCEVGDMIFCISDYDSSYSASDFSVIQNNLDLAAITNAQIDTIVAS